MAGKGMQSLEICVFTVVAICFLNSCKASSVTGTVSLDKYTFDKVLNKFDAVLVKFDSAYPYGDKHDEFIKFAQESDGLDNFIAAEIHVQDYGKRENSDLADRFSVPSDNKDNFPFVKLFLKNNIDNPIDFEDSTFTVESLKKFVKENSDIYFGLKGCLEYYDKLAMKFMKLSDNEKKSSIVNEANEESTKIPTSDQPSAAIYIKLMDRVLERGNAFIESEKTRVLNILKGKVTDQKRQELQIRLNILQSFQGGSRSRDEL